MNINITLIKANEYIAVHLKYHSLLGVLLILKVIICFTEIQCATKTPMGTTEAHVIFSRDYFRDNSNLSINSQVGL